MNKHCSVKAILFFLIVLTLPAFPQKKQPKVLYQTSPIISVMKGVMDDGITIGELKEKGSFGLGTFNGVNGEMIVLKGKVYRVNVNGKVNEPDDNVKTPYATVVNFSADTTFYTSKEYNYQQLKQFINSKLSSKNAIYALKVSGFFNSIKTRSEAKQTIPYKNLGDVLKNQTIFNLKNQTGTMVGFKFPKYLSNVNAAGFHFHFINAKRNAGGHVLNFSTGKIKIEIERINSLEMRIPETRQFNSAKLN